jgi:hypothetical protein
MLAGEIPVTAGSGLLTVSESTPEMLPPGPESETEMLNTVPTAMSFTDMAAVSWVELMKVVALPSALTLT